MRFWLRLAVTLLVLIGAALGVWSYSNRATLARQWMCYRVGAAKTPQEAYKLIQWFEKGPDREAKLRVLVEKWGTGNQQFDLYLARYVGDPVSSEGLLERPGVHPVSQKALFESQRVHPVSQETLLENQRAHPVSQEALRERFSLELGWREELLERWAHFWKWQSRREPDETVALILSYFDTLESVQPPKTIPWREVLDLQAIFCLAGHRELARRLKPSNWCHRYRQWKKDRQRALPHVSRPAAPFPDWKGPAPE